MRVEEPTSAAAYEMEINAIGAGLGVVSYVARPTADFRRRVDRDRSDYARFRGAYEQLDRSQEALGLSRSLDATYGEYEDLGTALMDRRDSQDALLARLNRLTSRLDALVRSRALSPVDRAVLRETSSSGRTELNRWVLLMAHYQRTGRAADLIRAREIRTRLDAGLDDLLAAGSSPAARSGYRTLRAGLRRAGTIGELDANLVPTPSSLSTAILPPWAW